MNGVEALPEMELLVQCAHLELGGERETRVRTLLREDVDPNRLLALAAYHRLAPLLHLHLKNWPDDGFPALTSLGSLCAQNARRMLQLTGELLEIVWLFEKHGILSVPYKGPALAVQLYGSLTLRMVADLDLLVRRSDVRRARELLGTRGYRPRHPLSSAGVGFMIENRYHETFVGAGANLELHWAFTNRDVGFPLDLDALASRLRPLHLGGHVVNAFSPEDLLLILCVHGAKHRWDRLEWLCGVAELLRAGELECGAVVDTAARLGVRRMLLLGLGLAHDLLEAAVPPAVLRHIRADRPVSRLAGEVAGSLLAGEAKVTNEPGDRDLFGIRLRDRWRDRVRFLFHRITTPSSPARWTAVPVGTRYFPLHAVLRPWTLGAKLVALARRRTARPGRAGGDPGHRSPRPLRILQVVQRPQRRGAEVFAYQLSAELRRLGHEVAIAYLYPYSGEGELPLGTGDRVLDGDEYHPLETLLGVQPALLRRVKRLIEEFQPDIIQVNGARTIKYGTVARWLGNDPARAVVYRNIGATRDWLRGMRRRLFYRVILRRLDGVVAISRASLDALRPRISPHTLQTVISNAIDPASLVPAMPRARLRAAVGTPSDAPVAVFVGALAPEKRVDLLIEAVRQVPALYLWIVGDGPLRARLEQQVERAGMTQTVRFFGVRKDVASYLAAADLLALSSDTEGVPAVVLEAGYLGLPVVATRVGGIPEVVQDGETGLLVPPGDRDALAAALARLAGGAELRSTLGRRACDRVAVTHSMEQIAQKYVEFYRALLRDGAGMGGPSGAEAQRVEGSTERTRLGSVP